MHRGGRATVAVFGCLLATALGVRALAQASFTTPYQTTDFSGEWWAVVSLCAFCRPDAVRGRLHGRALRLLRTAVQ